jgi:hypothetical protein
MKELLALYWWSFQEIAAAQVPPRKKLKAIWARRCEFIVWLDLDATMRESPLRGGTACSPVDGPDRRITLRAWLTWPSPPLR